MQEKPAFGSLESPTDYRDEYAMASVGDIMTAAVPPVTLPKTFHEALGSVLHQQKTPSCVSHSVVAVIRLYWFYKTGDWIDFSPRFLDVLAKRTDGQPIDGGTFPRLVMSLAAKYGCATTATVPNDTSLPINQYRDDKVLTPEAFAEALKWRIPGYVRVPVDPVSMRQAIFFYGAISVLYRVGEELWVPSWQPKDVDPLRTPKAIVSGHQMTPNGWSDEKLNILRNSWGATWGTNGETHYDPTAWNQYTIEAWAVAELPEDLKQYLSHLPKQADFHFTWNTDLKRGDTNDDVKYAQIALMILGFMPPVAPEDLGIFGPKTSLAVGQFQKANGISPVPDRIGPKTRKVLNEKFAV